MYASPTGVDAESLGGNVASSNGDLNIKYTSENSWEYIEEKDGEVFRVTEEINPDTNEVISHIEIQNNEGEFILDKKHISTPVEDGLEIETIKDGKKEVDIVELNKTENQDPIINGEGENLINPLAEDLTPWIHSYTEYYDMNFASLTVGIVTAALSLFFRLPAKAGFVASVASSIVAEAIPTVYTKQTRYVKNIVGTTILAGIKDYNYVYKYSNFTGLLESSVETEVID